MADLTTPLDRLLGGPTAKKLASSRDLHTVADLLGFLPRRYLDPATTTDLSTLHEGEYTVLVATVKTATTRPMRQRRGMMLTVTVTDGTHDMTLTFFKPYGHVERLVPGVKVVPEAHLAGMVVIQRGGV